MPSPHVVANEPGRRIKGKSNKPERREEQPVDLADKDFDNPTPAQQSKRAGPGTGGGRARSRRIAERAPKTAGARAKQKPKDTTMMDKGVEKKMQSALRGGKTPANLAAPANAQRKQPKKKALKKLGAKKATRRSAAPAEKARTQKQELREKTPRKSTVRDEGV